MISGKVSGMFEGVYRFDEDLDSGWNRLKVGIMVGIMVGMIIGMMVGMKVGREVRREVGREVQMIFPNVT